MRARSVFPVSAALLFLAACAGRTSAPPVDRAGTSFPAEWAFGADLEPGGNAVDAAIATHFALAVVLPTAGNLGGGGFLVVRMADGGRAALDFREKAPLAAHRDMFLDEDGQVGDRSTVGHLSVGVPGTPAGMWAVHRCFGTLPWEELVQPAVDLAEGFEVDEYLAGLAGPRPGGARALRRLGTGLSARRLASCCRGEIPTDGPRRHALADRLRWA